MIHSPANSSAARAVVRAPTTGRHTRNAAYRAADESSVSPMRRTRTDGVAAMNGAVRKLMPRERGALKKAAGTRGSYCDTYTVSSHPSACASGGTTSKH
ncbi:hypothetical protein ACFQ0Q_23605 [Streptomyces aureus]